MSSLFGATVLQGFLRVIEAILLYSVELFVCIATLCHTFRLITRLASNASDEIRNVADGIRSLRHGPSRSRLASQRRSTRRTVARLLYKRHDRAPFAPDSRPIAVNDS
jgi:hypothetical protein